MMTKQKYFLGYFLILLSGSAVSILIQTFNSMDVTFNQTLFYIYRFLNFIKLPFSSNGVIAYWQTIFYLSSPLIVLTFLPRGLSFKQRQNIRELGYSQKIKKQNDVTEFIDPTFKKHRNYLEMITTNLNVTLEGVVKNNEQNESVLNIKIARTEKLINSHRIWDKILNRPRTLSFKFYYDLFETMDTNALPYGLQHNELYLGKKADGNDFIIPLSNISSGYIAGTTGAGKSTMSNGLINQYRFLNPDALILVADTKRMSYSKKFIKKMGIQFFPMNTLEEITTFCSSLKELEAKMKMDRELFQEHEGIDHAELAREAGLQLNLPKVLILADEAARYLNDANETDKDLKLEKKKLVRLFTDFMAEGRSHSMTVILLSQRMHKDELAIPYDNIGFKCLNGLSEEMSRKYADGLVPEYAIPGKWYIKCATYSGFIKSFHKLSVAGRDTKSGHEMAIPEAKNNCEKQEEL